MLTKDPATEHTVPPFAICVRTQSGTVSYLTSDLLFQNLLLATLRSLKDHTA